MSFPSGSVVNHPPDNLGASGDKVPSRGREDPLEEEMATHSSILAEITLWTEKPGRLIQFMGLQRSKTWLTKQHHHKIYKDL